MATLEYRDYLAADPTQTGLRREAVAEAPAILQLVGLSPFEVPRGFDVEVDSRAQLWFRFYYPNDEPAAARTVALDRDGGLVATIGKHTGKVLDLCAQNAAHALSGPSPTLMRDLTTCLASLPHEQLANMPLSNLQLIVGLIAGLPDNVRRALSEAATGGG